jgi:hypothetical protein
MTRLLACLLTLLFSLSSPATEVNDDFGRSSFAANTAPEMFYIENGVRRSLVSRNAGLTEIPATIYRPGSAPTTTTLRLDQLLSPKPTVPLDSRYLRIQPPIVTPIQVQPLGLPGQMPSVPLRNVILE